MFRNLRLYQLHSGWPESEPQLSEQLATAAFKPCGSFTERSSGWEAPAGDDAAPLCRRVAGADLLRMRSQVRLLPAAVVNEVLEEKLEEFRDRWGREASRREKRQLKDEIHGELMPKAFVKSERVRGFCLHADKLIGIDTSSETQAERFLDQLREALGSLQVTPLTFKQPVSRLMTQVFLGENLPGFRAGRECRMLDAAAGGASVSWLDIDLSDSDVRKHVKNGMKLNRLGVEFDDLLSCVIDQDGVFRKIRLQGMDEAVEEMDEDPLAKLDAEFVLLTGAVQRLLAALKGALGGLA